MKTSFLYYTMTGLTIILFTTCKKDKKEDNLSVTGYYQGYIQAATGGSILNLGILHRDNSTSRLYQFPTGVADTTQVANNTKIDGVWSLNGKTYQCIFSKDNYTVTFNATLTTGSTIEGSFQQTGSATIGGTFVLNKK